MFPKKIPLVLILVPGLAVPVFASEKSVLNDRVGNGGFAHVCRDAKGLITSARLLDLWEAESLGAYASNRPVEAQIEEALRKLKDFSPNAYRVAGYEYDQLKIATVKVNHPLSKTEDAFPPYEPGPGCSYEQVARFEPVLTETGTSGLRINSEIYDSPFFTNSDRAALYIHEALYFMDRHRTGATNSQRARTLTGHLLSASPVPNAVRMLFSYVDGIQLEAETENEKVPVLALKDPLHSKVSLKIWSIEGVSADRAVGQSPEKSYRCVLNSEMPRKYDVPGDTGYLPLSEILGHFDRKLDRDVPGVKLTATVNANEFEPTPGQDREAAFGVTNAIGAQCYTKDASGKEVPVMFESTVAYDDAECMNVSDDGSTAVYTGEECEISLDSKAENLEKYPRLETTRMIGVVKARAQ
jgi:hypothetical protein